MKVAVVSPYDLDRHGGVQDQARRLVRWLSGAGHEAILVGPGTEEAEDTVLLGPARVISANRSAVPITLNFRIRGRLDEVVGDADIAHIHEPLMPLVGPAALRVEGPAKVATFHADPSRLVRSGYRFGRPVLRRILRSASAVTAVSPVAASAIERVVPCRLVPNGIDLHEYATGPKVHGHVAFLGRDDPRKGLDVLLAAWPRIMSVVPEARLSVIGAARPDPPPGVEFLGAVDDEEKRSVLRSASVLAAPNLGGESFGIVVAEGMAAGCAVVASAIPAFVTVLGDSGVLVAPGDANGLGEAVAGLLFDPDRVAALGGAARRRATRFDGAEVAGAYLDVYAEALERYGA